MTGTLQYSTKRSRAVLGYVGKRWEHHIAMALDSALNKWVDCVPEHRESSIFSSFSDVARILCLHLSTLGIRSFKETQNILGSIRFSLVSILRNTTPRS